MLTLRDFGLCDEIVQVGDSGCLHCHCYYHLVACHSRSYLEAFRSHCLCCRRSKACDGLAGWAL